MTDRQLIGVPHNSDNRWSAIDRSTPVLLLSSGHHGDLGIVRSLGRLGISVYVVGANSGAPDSRSKYCRKSYFWDIGAAPVSSSLEFLAGIGRQLVRAAILMGTSNSASLFIASNAHELRTWFIFPRQAPELVRSLNSKKEMSALAASVGIPIPQAFFPQSSADVLQIAETARFPMILKPVDERQVSGNPVFHKIIVRQKEELIEKYEIVKRCGHPNLMCQEFIPGPEEASWMFNGYFDRDSECLFGLTGKKIRQHRPYAGIASLAVCEPNQAVADATLRFMKAIHYEGILDIGYRYDSRDSLYKVFDVNPRIGCTFRLFVSDDGIDVVRAQYLDLTGQPVGPVRTTPGRKWMVEDLDLNSAFGYWRDGNLTTGGWARSFRGLREAAFLARDDLRPVVSRISSNATELFRRLKKRMAKRTRPDASVYAPLMQFFRSTLPSWSEIYERKDLYSHLYQERRLTAARFIDALDLPAGSRALDLGCGPGFTSIELARKGYTVQATDFVPEMAAATRSLGIEANVQKNLTVSVGEADRLPFRSGAFDLVVVLGVTEWLASLDEFLSEAARVLKPDGYLVVAFNNKWGLQFWLDPVSNPLLGPLRRTTRRLLERAGLRKPRLPGSPYSLNSFQRYLLKHELRPLRVKGLGFGPFTIMLRNYVQDKIAHQLNDTLQELADRNVPLLRSTSRIYVTLARRMRAYEG